MAKKISSVVPALNAPKKTTWLIALIAGVLGLILWIIGLCASGALAIIGPILLIISAGLLLLANSVKGL
ncbi:MAG: hypothetical protein Q4C13_05490 [Clostridia bacterium]|nr:hypothetical protein [Clostridia bacterium]